MKAYVGMKVQLHTYLTLILGDERLASRSGHVTTREAAAGIHSDRILCGPLSWSGGYGEAKNVLLLPDIETRSSAVRPLILATILPTLRRGTYCTVTNSIA
jgi:hypothetical protein